MKAENRHGDWIVTEGMERYNETESAQATSRLLEGSDDHGYAAEYVGYGTIDGVPVKAVYLLDDEDMQGGDGEEYEDAGNFDWDSALAQGRLIVDVDDLTDEQYDTLQSTGTLEVKNA